MLGKLIKYEYKATARLLLPLFGGVVLTWGVDALVRFLTMRMGMGDRTLVNSLFGFLAVMTILAAFLVTIFVGIRQFYRLLGEDGYLLFTLPTHPSAHMAAKLICGTGWFFALCLLASLLEKLDSWSAVHAVGTLKTTSGNVSLLVEDSAAVAGLLGVAVLGICGALLFAWLCVLIGSHWPQQRLMASIVTYFVLSFALRVGALAVLVVFLNWLAQKDQLLTTMRAFVQKVTAAPELVLGHMPLFWWVLGIAALVFLAADLILWFLLRWRLTKHLNLA